MPEIKEATKREPIISGEVVSVVEKLLEKAKNGEIVSVAYIAERHDGFHESCATRIENVYFVVGAMQGLGMRLLSKDLK